jgi:uncharacterized protein
VFTREHFEKIRPGLLLFNEQKYWECHEALEDLWMEDRQDPARNVYWAVIQVAAACIHYREKNLIGAQGMIFKAREKLGRCRDLRILSAEINSDLNWSGLESIVAAIPERNSRLEDFAILFDFRFP